MSFPIWANSSIIDSLEKELRTTKDDEQRLKLYSEVVYYHAFSNPKKALLIADTAIELATRIDNSQLLTQILYSKGVCYTNSGSFSKALLYYEEALHIAKEKGDQLYEANILNNIGIVYSELTAFERALDYFLEALKINESLNNPIEVARTKANLGNLFTAMRNYKEAQKYFEETLKIFEEANLQSQVSKTLNNIGEILKLQKKFDESLEYHLRALELRENQNDDRMTAMSLANVGYLYTTKDEYAKAIDYLEKALLLIDKEFDRHTLNITYAYLADAYVGLNDYSTAIDYLNKGHHLSEKMGAKNVTESFCVSLADYYSNHSINADSAFYYFRKLLKLKDTLYSEQTTRQIAKMKIVYETEKKERENKILTKEIAIKNLKIKQNRIYLYAILLGFLLSIGLSLFAYRAYRNKKKALEKEKELSQLRTQFISTVSHEFKTPLAGIMSSAQLLEFFNQAWDDEERQDYFNKIYGSVNHLKSLLDEVSIFGENEEFNLKFSPEKIDVLNVCKIIIEEVDSRYNKHIKIEFESKLKSSEYVMDKKLLRHIFSNLLSNAIKYSGNSKRIKFAIEERNSRIVFLVQDFGIGIPADELPEVFNKFSRAKNVKNIKGTGLGLAIVKNSVKLHNGNISIDSEVGKGTSVVVELPII